MFSFVAKQLSIFIAPYLCYLNATSHFLFSFISWVHHKQLSPFRARKQIITVFQSLLLTEGILPMGLHRPAHSVILLSSCGVCNINWPYLVKDIWSLSAGCWGINMYLFYCQCPLILTFMIFVCICYISLQYYHFNEKSSLVKKVFFVN